MLPDAGHRCPCLGAPSPAPPGTWWPAARWGCWGATVPGDRVGGRAGGKGTGFALLLPLLMPCRVEYTCVTVGWTPGVTDQDLRRSEVWLGNRQRLASAMARLSLLACCHWPVVVVMAGGSILLGHCMAPRGPQYANCLERWMNLTPLFGQDCGCVWRPLQVSRVKIKKNKYMIQKRSHCHI
jgi:hypothetical protein